MFPAYFSTPFFSVFRFHFNCYLYSQPVRYISLYWHHKIFEFMLNVACVLALQPTQYFMFMFNPSVFDLLNIPSTTAKSENRPSKKQIYCVRIYAHYQRRKSKRNNDGNRNEKQCPHQWNDGFVLWNYKLVMNIIAEFVLAHMSELWSVAYNFY